MNRFGGTNMPKDTEIRKAILDLLNKINIVYGESVPIGMTYLQYTNQDAPADIFGGTWENITSSYGGLSYTLWKRVG